MNIGSLKSKLIKQGFDLVEYHDIIGSTNERAIEILKQQDVRLGIIISENQTAGRGRGDRKWEMKPGSGLAVSFILPGIITNQNTIGFITGIGAVVVCQSVEKLYGISPEIKWPNDVLIDGRKFCGILTKAVWFGDELETVIIGIGINISAQKLPKIEKYPITSLEREIGSLIDRAELLIELSSTLHELLKVENFKSIIREWENRLAQRGAVVEVWQNENVTTGEFIGLDEVGGVVIQTEDQQKHIFYYGDLYLVVKS